MNDVPGWYGRAASAIAVLLSIWVGLHYRSPEWLALYGAAAMTSALLPAHRLLGAAGIVVGIAVAVAGYYLTRGMRVDLGSLASTAGGPLAPAREVLAIAVTAAWLLVGSTFRLLRA
jgi:hypothetical protein